MLIRRGILDTKRSFLRFRLSRLLDSSRPTSGHGFTLIELLLSMAIISTVFVFSAPLLNSFHWNAELNNATNSTVQSLRRAATLARSGQEDSQWGVRINSGSVTLFKGTSYATRDTAFDEGLNFATSITTGGINEVVFSKLTGLPVPTGTIIFTSPQGQARSVVVNSEGGLSY